MRESRSTASSMQRAVGECVCCTVLNNMHCELVCPTPYDEQWIPVTNITGMTQNGGGKSAARS
jgi:hypothetical protein